MSEGERVVRGAPPVTAVIRGFLKSSVGAKVIMAVTGLGLWGFVLMHMLGNLQLFQGAEVINAYGAFLRDLGHGAALWIARVGLIVIFGLHIFFGIRLASLNQAARPIRYQRHTLMRSNVFAKTMASSGLLLLAFLVFHLAHTTWGWILPQYAEKSATLAGGREVHDVHYMMTKGFSHAWVVLVYLAGQIVLMSHLIHGAQSLWQSLGLYHPVWSPAVAVAGRALAGTIVVLNLSIPIYFWWVNV